MFTIFFTTLLEYILCSKLLYIVIDGQKIISIMVNVALLKKKKKKKAIHKKIHNIFHNSISWQTFTSSHLDSPPTLLFYLLLLFYHINRCEKFCQIFCIYRLSIKKISIWFILISNNFATKIRL